MKDVNNINISDKIMENTINNKKLSHAYLFELSNLDDEIVFSFIKKIVCPNEYSDNCTKCNICSRISSGNYGDIKIIKPDGMWIKKEQLLELQNEFNKKSIESNKMIYVIYEADKMNKSSANTILKFLEEPEEGIIAILLTKNIHNVLNTIVSRCQIINYKKNEDMNLSIYDEEMINNVSNFINVLETEKLGSIAKIDDLWNNIFKQKSDVEKAIDILFLIYYYSFKSLLNKDINISDNIIKTVNLIKKNNDINNLKDKINIIMTAQDNIKYNVNSNLLMDKLIILFNGVDKHEISKT